MCLGSLCCTAVMSPSIVCSLRSGQGRCLSLSSADGGKGTEFGIVHETGGRARVWENPPFPGCGSSQASFPEDHWCLCLLPQFPYPLKGERVLTFQQSTVSCGADLPGGFSGRGGRTPSRLSIFSPRLVFGVSEACCSRLAANLFWGLRKQQRLI